MTKFWLVWTPTGPHPPIYRHECVKSAQREAERLAEQHSPSEFYVLEAVTVSKKASVVTTRLEEELPF